MINNNIYFYSLQLTPSPPVPQKWTLENMQVKLFSNNYFDTENTCSKNRLLKLYNSIASLCFTVCFSISSMHFPFSYFLFSFSFSLFFSPFTPPSLPRFSLILCLSVVVKDRGLYPQPHVCYASALFFSCSLSLRMYFLIPPSNNYASRIWVMSIILTINMEIYRNLWVEEDFFFNEKDHSKREVP